MSAKVFLKSLDCNNRATRNSGVKMLHRDKKKAIGQWMIIGTPSKPDSSFKCDTDVIWPVLNAEFFAEPPTAGETPYVCRHMIEAGD